MGNNLFLNAFTSAFNPQARAQEKEQEDMAGAADIYKNYYAQAAAKGIAKGTPEWFQGLTEAANTSGNAYMMHGLGLSYEKDQQNYAFNPQADPMITNDYKNFLLEQKQGYQGTFVDYQNMDANRKVARTSITMPEFKFPSTMIGIDSAKSIVDKNTGLNVSPGMSPEQLNAGMASGQLIYKDAKGAEELQGLNLAEANVRQMNELYFEATKGMPNSSGVTGIYDRAKYGISGALQQDGGSMKAYTDLANATAPMLARALGQVGSLSEGDVARAQALLASAMSLNPLDVDNRNTAIRKMNEVMAIIQTAKSSKGGKPLSSRYVERVDKNTGKTVVERYYTPAAGQPEVYDDKFMVGRM